MKKFSLFLITVIALLSCNSIDTDKSGTKNYKVPSRGDLALAPPFPNFEQLVGISPLIFTGIVSGIRYGSHEQSVYPFTFIKFKGVELIKNKANLGLDKEKSFEISYMGGLHSDLTISEVDEFPKFELGQRYLIFIRGGAWKLSPIAGNTMGVYKLYGSLEDDPLVLTTDNNPIKGIEEGSIVLSNRVSGEEEEIQRNVFEKEIKREDKKLKEEEIERLEKDMRFKEKDISKEKDTGNQLQIQFDKVMKLSDLINEIEKVGSSLDLKKYEKFSSVFLVPLKTKGGLNPKASDNK